MAGTCLNGCQGFVGAVWVCHFTGVAVNGPDLRFGVLHIGARLWTVRIAMHALLGM